MTENQFFLLQMTIILMALLAMGCISHVVASWGKRVVEAIERQGRVHS